MKKINSFEKGRIVEMLDWLDVDALEVEDKEGNISKIKFEICDTAVLIFNVDKLCFDYIRVFKGRKIEYMAFYYISEFAGLYYDKYMEDWKSESDKVYENLEDESDKE